MEGIRNGRKRNLHRKKRRQPNRKISLTLRRKERSRSNRSQSGTDEKGKRFGLPGAFLVNTPSPNRSQTYINRDIYERIKRFLPLIAPEVSIASYISNILGDHIERHWEEINEMYSRELSKPL